MLYEKIEYKTSTNYTVIDQIKREKKNNKTIGRSNVLFISSLKRKNVFFIVMFMVRLFRLPYI